jgi:protein-S-isoprenylcysteine O-methyltransferase Ste14
MTANSIGFISAKRILISRIVAIILFVLVLLTDSSLEETMIPAYLFLFGLLLVGIATAGRLWCALYISGYKNQELITSGPYSISRNPLYFFSLLGFAGIGFATETISFGIAAILLFASIYPFIIRQEEHFLRSKFGQTFEDYCVRTPRFFPKWNGYQEPESYVVNPKIFRRAAFDVLWFVWLAGILGFIEELHEHGIVNPIFHLP